MPKLSDAEKADMIIAAEDSFNDTCTIHVLAVPVRDGYSEEVLAYTDLEEVECGFSSGPEYENERGAVVTLDADAILRLSLDQAISVKDEVTVRDERYTVDGVLDGRTARIVALKKMATS